MLQELLSIFRADRVYALTQMGVEFTGATASFSAAVEAHPCGAPIGSMLDFDPSISSAVSDLMESSRALYFTPTSQPPLARFTGEADVRAELVTALHPKVGGPWLIVLQACEAAPTWGSTDERLLTDIARRIGDAVGTRLARLELQRSRQDLAIAHEIALTGRWRFDLTSGLAFISNRAFDILGIRPRVKPLTLDELFANVVSAEPEVDLKSLLVPGKDIAPFDFVARVKDEDGSLRFVQVRGATIQHPTQSGIVNGALQDITEQRLREDELRVLKNRLADAQLLARVGSWEFNVDTGEVWWSDEVFALFGVDPSEGQPSEELFESLLHPDDFVRFKNAMQGAIQGGEAIEIEYRICRRDGSECTVLSRGRRLEASAQRFSGVVIDVTELRQRDREVEKLQHRLTEAQDISGVGSWEWDLTNDSLWWSEQHYKLWGVSSEEFEPQFERVLTFVHEEDYEALRGAFARSIESGKPFRREFRVRRADGELRWVESRGELEMDRNDHPSLFKGTIQDITDQRSLDAKVQQAQKLESLGVLAGGIAHDFNNLLVGMLGNASLVMRELPPETRAFEFVSRIEEAARRAAELTRQMLAYSGKGTFVTEQIDISNHVMHLTHLLEVSISKSAVLKFSLSEHLPAVECDVAQFTQVVMNLIINASDAIGERSGVIHVSTGLTRVNKAYLADTLLDEDLPEGYYVYLEVSDTGSGMDDATKRKIFDPFFTTKFTGRGLGLAAVLGIIRGHRGAIKVYSEVGKGTSMKVLLPTPHDPLALEYKESSTDGGANREEREGMSGCVLVVDDEETVRSVAQMMVEAIGMKAIAATDGKHGVEVFERRHAEIDIVLLDMTMPRMNGQEAFAAMRAIKPDVRVVLSSGYNEQDATDRFSGKGLAGFLQKPFDLAALEQVLSEAKKYTPPS